MSKLTRSFFPAVLLAALCSPFVMAQTEPGSLDDLLGADFAPLATQDSSDQQLPDLHAPLLLGPPAPQRSGETIPQPQIGPLAPLAPVPQLAPVAPVPMLPPPQSAPSQSVLDIPRVTAEEPAPGALVLPELTMPTPENTGAVENQHVLRPQLDVRPQAELELLPFDDRNSIQARQPQMRTPRALPYGNSSQQRQLAVPIQIEFFTVTRRYAPYGGYGSGGYGYRSYGSSRSPYGSGGYRPSGGYAPYGYGRGGRDCPSRR